MGGRRKFDPDDVQGATAYRAYRAMACRQANFMRLKGLPPLAQRSAQEQSNHAALLKVRQIKRNIRRLLWEARLAAGIAPGYRRWVETPAVPWFDMLQEHWNHHERVLGCSDCTQRFHQESLRLCHYLGYEPLAVEDEPEGY